MTIPALLLGLSLLIFFHQSGIPRSLATIVIGHVTFTLPFVLVIVTSRLAGFDLRLEDAARDLGASQLKTFWEVTLPLIFPAVLAGALFAFTLSLDDFIVAFLLTGTEVTLPLKIWTMVRFGLSLKVNALATMLFVTSFLLVSASLFFMRDRSARRPG
jgi:spermidine/putrescine transport system permease protein